MVPYFAAIRISIHALREEGDRRGKGQHRCRADFYPRPPRGGRPAQVTSEGLRMLFLSTPSARRATDALPTLSTAWMISIHALREEGDLCHDQCETYRR